MTGTAAGGGGALVLLLVVGLLYRRTSRRKSSHSSLASSPSFHDVASRGRPSESAVAPGAHDVVYSTLKREDSMDTSAPAPVKTGAFETDGFRFRV